MLPAGWAGIIGRDPAGEVQVSRKATVSAIVFILFMGVSFFADGVRVRLETKDPSSLPPVATGVPRLSQRVVLVILDSVPLRVGTDPDIMPNLVALAGRGASGVLIAPPDTTTTAGVRAMTAGTKPGFHDTLEMFSHNPFAQWTIFDELVARGESVAFHGDHAWADLLGDRAKGQHALATSENLFANDEASLAAARERLRSSDRPAFAVLHIGRTDFIAHQFGTERPEYRERLREVDGDLNRFFLDVFDEGTTFIVTADHGCDHYGNHGGGGEIYRRVPVVLLGSGILPVHGFEMESRQMPLVLAALLGTRLPAGILETVPTAFLALGDAQRTRLALANLGRVQALAAFHHVDAEATGKNADDAVGALLAAINVSSRPEPGTLLWILVIFLGMALVYLMTITAIPGLGPAFAMSCGLLGLLGATSSLRLPALILLAALEAGLVAAAVWKMSGARPRLGAGIALLGAIGIAAVSGARFAKGGAFLIGLAKPFAAVAAISIAGALMIFRRRLRDAAGLLAGAELCAIPLVLFALGVLKPIDLVPVLMCGLMVWGLRANKVRWLHIACAAAGLFVFFFVSQRVVFGFTGERPAPRYLYAGLAGTMLAGLLTLKFRYARRWLVPATMCLFALWPFGFVTFGHAPISGARQTSLLTLTWIATVAFAWQTGILRICAVPLITALAYHLFPGETSFLVALAAHLATLPIISARGSEARVKHLSIAGIMFSLLFVMSPELDILSVILFSSVLFFATRVRNGDLDDSSLVLLGAFLLTYVRYGILNSFGHTGEGIYTLSNVDTHSGFAAMSKDVKLWIPTALIVLKMVCASTLVFALILSNERCRRLQSRLVLVGLAIAMGFLVESSIQLALSYGPNEGRLSSSMVQVTFHVSIILVLSFGYAAYNRLLLGPTVDERAAAGAGDRRESGAAGVIARAA
jgi:hypothetical protein